MRVHEKYACSKIRTDTHSSKKWRLILIPLDDCNRVRTASTCLHSAAAVMGEGAVKAVCVLAMEQSVLTARRVILEDARILEKRHVLTPVTKTLLTVQADPMS